MNGFRDALDHFILAWAELNEEWEMIEDEELKSSLSLGYPFDKKFNDQFFEILEWKKSIDPLLRRDE